MKKFVIAAGIGLGIFTVTMAATSNNRYAGPVGYTQTVNDTTPKKDTTKPKPDTTKLAGFQAVVAH